MDYDGLVEFVQAHFSDGLAMVIGSGLSSAEGIPGMPALATHLRRAARSLSGTDAAQWSEIEAALAAGEGLEGALLKHPPTETLEGWLAQRTCELLIPEERKVIGSVIRGERTLRLTNFLAKILKPPDGLPILTTNYDRLIEVACEIAGMHVDTTAVGQYAGEFDYRRSCMGSCRGLTTRAKTPCLDHYPRAVVLKPHGSFDWYRYICGPRRCSLDLDAERLIITPGLNKYRAGYDSPFDKHRDLANDMIEKAGRLLIVGYGFNDDHLQGHLLECIRGGTPTLILNRCLQPFVEGLSRESPRCVCLSQSIAAVIGVAVTAGGVSFEHLGHDLWDLGVLTQELLT